MLTSNPLVGRSVLQTPTRLAASLRAANLDTTPPHPPPAFGITAKAPHRIQTQNLEQ